MLAVIGNCGAGSIRLLFFTNLVEFPLSCWEGLDISNDQTFEVLLLIISFLPR